MRRRGIWESRIISGKRFRSVPDLEHSRPTRLSRLQRVNTLGRSYASSFVLESLGIARMVRCLHLPINEYLINYFYNNGIFVAIILRS